MTVWDLLTQLQADLQTVVGDVNAIQAALQGLDISTLTSSLQALSASVATTVAALPAQASLAQASPSAPAQ